MGVTEPRAIATLRRLIGFDTTSSRSNLPLIRFVAGLLQECGVRPQLLASGDGGKASLLASIGPEVEGGVVLSGHTDTVPVSGQDWSSDPFTLVERQGRWYGRGTADMKGFLAAALALVPEWCARPLGVPIHLALSYDEEVGCLAAPALVGHLMTHLPRPAFAIVGEPSEMKVADRHRGISLFETFVRGRAGHAGSPDSGVSAIAFAAECIRFLTSVANQAEPGGAGGADRRSRTTVNVGIVEGGSAANVIAGHCRFVWECRPAAGASADDVLHALQSHARMKLLPRMQVPAPEARIETATLISVPPLAAGEGSAAAEHALRLTAQSSCVEVPFASEAGYFQRAGVPAVICGPGSPAQAHQADEYVTGAQIDGCVGFLRRLAQWAERP